MSQNKFTPGPWVTHESRSSGFCIVSKLARNAVPVVSCIDEYDHYGPIHSKENAALISAAPDMLIALEKGITRLETCIEDERYMREGSMTYLLEIFKDAVAKARGDHEQA